jgi:hypothetical protein
MKKQISLLLFLLAVIMPGCSESSGFGNPGESLLEKKPVHFKNHTNAVILKWNTVAQEIMAGPTYNCLVATRVLAMMHIAMHDALNNIAPVYETYRLTSPDKKADPIAAVSSAAYTVLHSTFPDKKSQLDAAFADALLKIKNGDAKDRGLNLGKAAGDAIVLLRSNDDPFRDPIGAISNPEQPGLYQPVPPMPFVYGPFWKDMTPFSLESPAQFRIAPFPSLTSQHYAEDLAEVKQNGSINSASRSAEETAIAKFWYELSEIGWNRVAKTAASQQNLDLLTTTRLFALVNIALADSYIAGWDSKFYHNFWRPYTAIRAAGTDGNDATESDLSWEPLMPTPPVHDYPSTHSTLGNAAAVVLSEVIGREIGFTMTSTSADPTGTVRSFRNFSEAARENSESRVPAGIHFRFSCEKGLELGEKIGFHALETKLRPLNTKQKSL